MHRDREKTSDYQWRREGYLGLGGGGRHKQLGVRQATRRYCKTQGREPIFHNTCKWKPTFKRIA